MNTYPFEPDDLPEEAFEEDAIFPELDEEFEPNEPDHFDHEGEY